MSIKRKTLQTIPILERSEELSGVIDSFVKSSEEAWEVLTVIGDRKRDENGNFILGKNALVNEKGLRAIIIEIRSVAMKDIGIGYRTPLTILKSIRYSLINFVWNLKRNMFNWGIKFDDCMTIICAIEKFYNAIFYKSYNGQLLTNLAGGVQTSETIKSESNKKGLGIFSKSRDDEE